jgi:LAS seventeen-binding protein 1/2
MGVQDPNQALLSHVVSQTQANIDFLIAQNYISRSDAAGLLNKLGSVAGAAPSAIKSPGVSSGPKVRAIWGYNETGGVRSFILS